MKHGIFKGQKEERFLIRDIATHGCSGGCIEVPNLLKILIYDKHKK
jgi:hypothetical protein